MIIPFCNSYKLVVSLHVLILIFFAMGRLVGLLSKNYEIPPSQVKNHILKMFLYIDCFTWPY